MMPLEKPEIDVLREIYRISLRFEKYRIKNKIGCTWKYSGDADEFDMHVRRRWFGFVGSYLVARHLDVDWNEGIRDFSDRHDYGDAGEFDVRTRSSPAYELSIRSMDKRPTFLVKPKIRWSIDSVDWADIPNLYLCGFHFPECVRKPEWAADQPGVYFMPDKELLPMACYKYIKGFVC